MIIVGTLHSLFPIRQLIRAKPNKAELKNINVTDIIISFIRSPDNQIVFQIIFIFKIAKR